MRLSEAIRLGAMLKPQGRGAIIGARGRTCALGAALDAIGALTDEWDQARLPKMWSWACEQDKYRCPACARPRRMNSTFNIITHLNDRHRWTREAIADWVATIEPKAAIEPTPIGELEETCPPRVHLSVA